MKKRILAISLSVAVLLVSLTVAGMLTVTADTTIDWQDGTYSGIVHNSISHSDVGQVAAVEAGTYNPDENLIKGVATGGAALTDGLLPGDDGFTEASFTQTPDTFKVTTYDLGSVATIDRFLVAGGSTAKVSYIKIYASLTDSTPADDEANLVAAKIGLHKVSDVAWLRATNELKARYVAFALYSPPGAASLSAEFYNALNGWGGKWGSWAIYAGEYGIFGTKVIKSVETAETSVKTYGALSDNMKYVIDNNILTAADLKHCHNYVGTYKDLKFDNANDMFDGKVFDKNLKVSFDDSGADTEANRMVWYEFAFSQEMDISSFLIAAGATHGIEGFDVYVTKTASAINIIEHPSHYTPVYSYTSALGTDAQDYWPKKRTASAVMVEFGEIQKGSHLIFKFQTSNNKGYTIAGLSEIAVVGGVAPIENLGAQLRARANDDTVADLRFVFELNASGVAYGEGVYRAIAPDAKVCIDGKIYTLEGYGAVVSLDGDAIAADNVVITDEGPVKEVEALKLYEVNTANKKVTYTVVVTDVPNSNFDEPIYARAYVDYHNGIESVRVYDEVIVKTVNGVETAAVNS